MCKEAVIAIIKEAHKVWRQALQTNLEILEKAEGKAGVKAEVVETLSDTVLYFQGTLEAAQVLEKLINERIECGQEGNKVECHKSTVLESKEEGDTASS